jgi:hypothetical protein
MGGDFKVIAGILALTVVVFVGGILWYAAQSADERAKLAMPLLGEKMPDQGGLHIAQGAEHEPYNSNPPTSGPMWGSVAGPGVKSEQVPDELVLHSMEHGAAVVWYRSDLPKTDVEKITVAFNAASGKKIMSPRAGLDVPVALASWNYLLRLDSIDEAKVTEFINTNNDRSPEKGQI